MKLRQYIIGFAAAAGALCGCQDEFDSPVVEMPVSTLSPTMSILELKQQYWNDATNFIAPIGGAWLDANGDTIDFNKQVDLNGAKFASDGKACVISGRVISSDEAGNVFKNLVIQDETAALALSINSYNLYLKYRVGQQVVLDLSGMFIGKYNGLLQLGMPEWYANGNANEATFMAPEFFEQHVQLNGFPQPELIDTIEINSFADLPSNPDGLMKYQSQLVKFNNVYFQNGGTEQFSTYHSSGVNQNIVDSEGATLPVRTSGYSNFWNNFLPKGNGDVVAINSYYGTTGWQLLLIDYAGCMNFGNPTVAPGGENNPYEVMDAIAAISAGKTPTAWVSGYIVGAVAPEVTAVTKNEDVEWSADVVLANTLVIGATPETKDISQALVISLPQGSALRKYGNLVDNPSNYKKEIRVKGSLGYYMEAYGVNDNSGSATDFKIEGVTIDEGGVAPAGDGTEASPYNVPQIIAMNPQGNKDNPDVKNAWVTGYIVGWADMSSVYYINTETARFSVPATANTNLILGPTPETTDVSKCIGIQLPSGTVRSALNLVDNPGNLGKALTLCGNICKYSGIPGMRDASKYKLDGGGDTPDTPQGEPKGSGTADDPYNVAKGIEVAKANGESSNVNVYMGGYVKSGSINMNYATGTWQLCDNADGTGAEIKVYACKDFNNEKFTDANKVKAGDYIVVCGPLINYMGNTPESSYGYLYSLNGETGSGDNPGVDPDPDPVTGNTPDFNTFNNSSPATTDYTRSYSTASGWTTEWALILPGGTDNTNFISTDAKVLSPCLDGTPSRVGKLTSPTIAGGISKLVFKYGFPYNEKSAIGFTVNIKQDGSVVATKTVKVDSPVVRTAYEFDLDCSVSGDFTIEIVNDAIGSGTTTNYGRVAIFGMSWEN